MTVCPFCNKAVPDPQTPCRSCGRRAGDAPPVPELGGRSLGSDAGWDDPSDLGGGLDLSRGGSMASHASGPSAYSGGGLSLGDDDDPFADDGPQNALELDLPSSHTANAPRQVAGAPVPAASQPAPVPPSSVPDLVLPTKPAAKDPPSSPQPRAPQSDPALHAAGPPSDPALRAQHPQSNPALRASPPASDPALHARPPASDPALRASPPASDPALQSQPQIHQVAPPRPQDPAALIARYPVPPEKVWEAPAYALKVLWRQLELRQDLATLRKRRSPDVRLYERALQTHDEKTFALGLAITCAGLAFATFVFFLPVILRFLRAPD